MNKTKIQIIGENGGFLELKENTSCPLNFAIADIKDVSKKKGAFSKSITLVGNKNNNLLLGNYFDVNIQAGTFDVNKIVECNIIQNDIPVLQNGILQLVSVNKEQKGGNAEEEITYTVLVKDNTSDFFTQIANKELTDLTGFSWMNHNYTADVVFDSFDNTIADGYKYIMPYTPEGQTTLDDASLDLTEFSPGIYAKIYFDKIFQQAGYSYSWPEMDSDDVRFSKLIIPFNGEKPVVNAVEVLDYTAEVESTSTQTYSTRTANVNTFTTNRVEITDGLYSRINMPSEISDPSNRWNSLGSFYNPPNLPSNQNSIEVEYEVDWELITNSFGTAYLKKYNTSSLFKFNIIPQIRIRRTGTSQYLTSTNIYDTDGSMFKFSDGTFIPSGTSVAKSGTISFKQLAPGIDPAYNIEIVSNVQTSNGWMFKATNNIAGANITSTSFGFRITNIRCKIKSMVEGTYGYGIPVDMSRYVPQKVKQSDYIKSIFTMFNLFAEVDKDNPKRINLVSRDKYYDDGKINDWTKKLVKNKPQEIKFLPELSSKSMILTYKEDTDISNKIYKEAVGEVYGQQKFTFDNEFVKEEKKTEIIFSPTPMFNTKFGAVCPMWLGGAPKCNLRILYDGGEYPCENYVIVNYRLNSGSINQMSGTTYPYVGHWDKPDNPTFDLNFGVNDFYFRSDDYGALTNNNLFNLHWRRTLNQINSGKLMSAYFNLNETDILNVKLNDKIRIDNSWWNINAIKDYDANSNQPTKVELISIDDTLKIPFSRRITKKIADLSTDLIAIPIRTITGERYKFLTVNLSPYDIEVKGKYNYITENVTTATIVGDGNLVADNSTVYGSNNIVASETTIYGSNNITGDDSNGSVLYGDNADTLSGNTFYTNNIVISSGGTINNIPVSGSTFEPTLQDVTDNGNFTTTPITLNGGFEAEVIDFQTFKNISMFDEVSLSYITYQPEFPMVSSLIYSGSTLNLSNNGFGITGISNDEENENIAYLKTENLTSNRTFQFPNNSGTLALLSDTGVPTLQQVTDSGNTTTNSIIAYGGLEGGDSSLLGGYLLADQTSGITCRYHEFFPGDQYNTVLSINSTGFGIINNKNLGNTAKAILSTSGVTTSDKIFSFPNTSGTIALTSDLASGSPVWKKSGLINNANAVNEVIYRQGKTNLVGSNMWFGTGPTQADVDNETLGTSFGHVTPPGGFTSGFVQMFGNSNNGGNPNVFIGKNTHVTADAQMSFTSVSGISYNGWGGDKNLFRFKNGYSSGNVTLIDIGTQYSTFYKETRFRENIRLGDTTDSSTITASGVTGNIIQELPNAGGMLTVMRNSAPASATDTGVVGEFFADSSYLYVCVATNTWRRTALSSW